MSNLFLHLLNISITAGWIVLVVVLLRFVLKKAPKWIRVVLWGLVALRLLVPVSIESALSLVPSAETVRIEPVTAPVFTSVNEYNGVSYFYENVRGEQIVLQSGFSALNSAVNPTIETVAKQFDTVAILKTVAGWVWLAGVCGMLLYALISFLRLRHRVRASVLLEKGVYVCDEISDPFILGLIVPKIYLPSGMDEQTRAYVLSHERAHLKRFDYIWKPLGFLLLSIYWFNPLLWLAYILLCRDIELACDEKVVKELDDAGKAAYSEALVHASVSRRMVSACPLAFGETGVKGRVKSVLNYKKPAFWIILVAILACVAVAVCFLTMPKKNKVKDLTFEEDVTVWFEDWDYENNAQNGPQSVTVPAFPGVTFRWKDENWGDSILAEENGETRKLFSGMPVWNVFFADVTGDGKPELCASVYFGSGIVDEHIVVYDYVNKQSYVLLDRMQFDYHLYTADGRLFVGKTPYMGDKQIDYGTIVRQGAALFCRFQSDGSMIPLMKELHESEVLGEWLVEEERDANDNVIYTRSLDLWKEYNFRDDGTVTYTETVPYSSDYELAFGHPKDYPYAVYDGTVHIGSRDEGNYYGYGYLDETGKLQLTVEVGTNEFVYATLRRMGADASEDSALASLRQNVPEYFDLPADKGLEIYVWQMAPDDYRFGVMAGTNLRKENEQLWNLRGVSAEQMRLILSTYNIAPENIEVIPFINPISSYAYEINDAYTAFVREMLFGGEDQTPNAIQPEAPSTYVGESSLELDWVHAEDTVFNETGSAFGYLQEQINVRRYMDSDRSRIVYALNGMTYKEVVNLNRNISEIYNTNLNEIAFYEFYSWFYDRSFFSFYANTNIGTLYRNNLVDTLEVLILKDEKGIEHILAAEQSDLLDISKYDAKDFGLLAFSDNTIYQASQFSWILDIHTGRSIENASKAEEFHEIYAFSNIYLTWQYTRIPGLRYEFLITIDLITKENYIYSRAERCMYKLQSPLTANE